MYPQTNAIAHAGGRVLGRDYTNSIVAFDTAYAAGFRMVEVDFQETADGVTVCGHDWAAFAVAPTLAAFEERRASDPLVACTLDALDQWLDRHPDVQLMSDVKSDAVAVNAALYQRFGDRLTAQAYSAEQVRAFHDLGISHIVLTMYRLNGLASQIAEIDALRDSGLDVEALTLPVHDALIGTALVAKHRLNVPVLSHTINDCFTVNLLWLLGVDAVYTDDLGPRGCGPS